METKLECKDGWVKIQRIIDEGKESVKIITNTENDREIGLTFSYYSESAADSTFENLSKSNPDELRDAIMETVGNYIPTNLIN